MHSPFDIWKRVSLRWLHQPSSFFMLDIDSKCFEWRKTPLILPAPPFKYLYVHQAAKSTPQLCNCNSTAPTACAKSQPT